MSTTVDNRVVEMRFDNSNFESNVKQSMSTLEKLKQALKFSEGTKGLDQVSAAAKNVKFNGMESGIETLKSRFSTLGVVGMSVINRLTNTAMNFGKKLYSNTVGQVVQGGWQRASNIEQARFTLQGVLKDGEKVKVTMKEAMDSVDGTAYGFDQAALAASQFASSGVKNGEQMQHALAAVAGTAATTGKDYAWISQIFTRVAGQGRVMATDLNSLAAAGTNAAVELANFMNGVNDGSIEASDSMKKAVREISKSTKLTESDIRDFVSKGKISFDIFSEAMNNSFGEHAKDANKTFSGALDNVKARLKQIGQKFYVNNEDDGPLGILNENSPVVLFLNDLRKALTGVRDAIDPLAYSFRDIINTIAEAGSGFLKFFDTTEKTKDGVTKNKEAMAIFQNVVYGLTNLLNGFWSILQAVGKAFTEAFPSVNLKTLNALSTAFVRFSTSIVTNKALISGIQNTFKSLFAIIRIIGTVLKNVFYIVSPLLELLPWLSAGIFGVTGSLSDQLVALADAFGKWDGLKNIMAKVSDAVKRIGDALTSTFEHIEKHLDGLLLYFGESGGGITGFIAMIAGAVAQAAEVIVFFFGKLLGVDTTGAIDKIWETFRRVRDAIENFTAPLQKAISYLSNALSLLRARLSQMNLAGIVVAFKNFGSGVGNALSSVRDKIKSVLPSLSEIKEGFSNFGETIKNIGTPIVTVIRAIVDVAKQLIGALDFGKVAAAGGIGVLVAWVYKLYRGTLLVTSMFKEYLDILGKKAMDAHRFVDLIDAVSGTLYSLQLKLKSEALRSIAVSIAILAAALFVLSTVDANKLTNAATAIGELFVMLIGSLKLFAKFDIGKTEIAIAQVIGISAAVFILAMALKKLAKLDPQGVLVGVLAMAGMLFMLAEFLHLVPERELAGLAGPIIGLSVALYIMATALKKLAKLNPQQLLVGLLGIVGLLGSLTLFMNLIPEHKMATTAGSLIGLAIALRIMVMSVKAMGKLDFMSLAKGLMGVVAILGSLAMFTNLVSDKKLTGTAVAIGVISVSMLIFTKAIEKLGSMDFMSLATGLLGIVGILTAIAMFTSLVKPDKIIVTSIAFVVFGGAMLLFSTVIARLAALDFLDLARGLLGLAGALTAVALFTNLVNPAKMVSNAIGMVIMAGAMTLMVGVVERLAALSWSDMTKGLIGFAAALVIVGAATYMMTGALAGAVSLVVVAAAMNLLIIPIEKLAKIKLGALVKALVGLAAGLAIIGVAGAVLGIVSPLILAFGIALTTVGIAITAIGAGFFLIASAISMLATAMSSGMTKIMAGLLQLITLLPVIGTQIGQGIINMVTTILNGADQVISGIVTVGQKLITALAVLIPQVANLVGLLILSILTTIDRYLPAIIEKAGNIITNFLYGMGIQMPRIITAATFLMIMLMQGIANNLPIIFQAGIEIVGNLVQGLLSGIWSYIGTVIEAFAGLGKSILGAIKGVLGINSPSTEMYDVGQDSIQGLLNAIQDGEGQPVAEMGNLGGDMLSALQGSASSGDFQGVGANWLSGLTAGLNSGETGSSGQKAASDAAAGAGAQVGLFGTAGNDLMSQMVTGLDQKAPDASTSVGNAAQSASQAVRPYQGQFVASGRYLMLGLVKGIKEKAPDAAAAASAAGRAAVTALQQSIKQGSPSKLTYQSGIFFDEGFINGMKSLAGMIGIAARHVGDKAFTEFNSAIDKVAELMSIIPSSDWNPTITPVVDLSNVAGSIRSINDIFGSTKDTIKLAEDTNLQMSANAMELQDYGMKVNNEDVVRSIRSLSNDISDLKSTIKNLRMVMDTGAVVGELRDPMDKALGMKARHITRGG